MGRRCQLEMGGDGGRKGTILAATAQTSYPPFRPQSAFLGVVRKRLAQVQVAPFGLQRLTRGQGNKCLEEASKT